MEILCAQYIQKNLTLIKNSLENKHCLLFVFVISVISINFECTWNITSLRAQEQELVHDMMVKGIQLVKLKIDKKIVVSKFVGINLQKEPHI